MSECSKDTTIPPEVEELLASCSNLPSLPSVVLKIIDASKDPDIATSDIKKIVQIDPALSAKLLKIANSPIYARRRQITNLSDALALLGVNASIIIALSFSLVSALSNTRENSINYDEFWKRSILSASIARLIGEKLKLPNLEDLFLASLLQDIGILVMDSTTNQRLKSFFENKKKDIANDKEPALLDHSDVGAWLLKSWDLPEKLYKAVLCSHTSYKKPAKNFEDEIFYQCVGLSSHLAQIWFDDNKEQVLIKNFHSVESLMGFNEEEFNQMINDISASIPEISSLFDITIADEKKRDEVLNEARNILLERNINLLQDLNEQKAKLDTLNKQSKIYLDKANFDYLTRTYTRQYIEQELDKEFDNAKSANTPLSLAFIDLDDFKIINDNHGHQAGDKVLQEFAYFCQSKIRNSDVLARYGGDEFLLLLPATNAKTANDLLTRLLSELKAAPGVEYKGEFIKFSTSIGVASYTVKSHINNTEDLISAADKALYNAKKSGKNKLLSI